MKEYVGRWFRRGRNVFLVQGSSYHPYTYVNTTVVNLLKVDEYHIFSTTMVSKHFLNDIEDGLMQEIPVDEALQVIKEVTERMKDDVHKSAEHV